MEGSPPHAEATTNDEVTRNAARVIRRSCTLEDFLESIRFLLMCHAGSLQSVHVGPTKVCMTNAKMLRKLAIRHAQAIINADEFWRRSSRAKAPYRRLGDEDTTVNPSSLAASVSRSSNATNGTACPSSRCR